ncbi:hypothetical protein MSIMFI_05510 [Mycobacterium simulans]|nr:hypothetical protein MSIMFI_05510 [Mycobacterium simulans]
MGQIRHCDTFIGTYLLDMFVLALFASQVDIPPPHHGISQNDLHRLWEPIDNEPGPDVGVTVDHRLYSLTQTLAINSAGQPDADLRQVRISAALPAVIPALSVEQ